MRFRRAPLRTGAALAILVATSAVAVRPAAAVPLQEAGRRAGIRVGVLGELRGGAQDELLEREFEVLVAHGFSWNVIHPQPDVWNFASADRIVDYAAAPASR